jgi:hypothetical protein
MANRLFRPFKRLFCKKAVDVSVKWKKDAFEQI